MVMGIRNKIRFYIEEIIKKIQAIAFSCEDCNKIKVFPMAPDDMLDEEKIPNMKIYNLYLNSIFKNDKIHNIALTGKFGVGKSSVIRSFERQYCHGKKSFLYISLGNLLEGEQGEEDVKKIEYRLLRQIYAKFKKSDLPYSTFKLIPENKNKFFRTFFSCGCGMLMGGFLALLSYSQINQIALKLYPQYSDLIQRGYLIIISIAILVVASITVVLSYLLLPHIGIKNISVDLDKIGLDMEKEDIGFLDHYSAELVYCLYSLREKYNFTIVFEDMDRFDDEIYQQIFMRLREINFLINQRIEMDMNLSKRGSVRFIYVVNDKALYNFAYSKFFDYILPIIPFLNIRSAEYILKQNICSLNASLCNLNSNIKRKWFSCIESISENSFIHQIAPFLDDFRIQFAILNEYGFLFLLFFQNSFRRNYENQINEADSKKFFDENNIEQDIIQIMAFAIYKCIWPKDYNILCESGKSDILPNFGGTEKYKGKYEGLLEFLTNNSFLTERCFYYIGFSEIEVSEIRKKRMEDLNIDKVEKVRLIDNIKPEELASLKMVQKLCEEEEQEEIQRAFIRCMIRCKFSGCNMFFSNRTVRWCIDIMSEMDDESIENFFDLCRLQRDNGFRSLFDKCIDYDNDFINGEWTERQVDIYCMGTIEENRNMFIAMQCADGSFRSINLSEKVKEYNKKDH